MERTLKPLPVSALFQKRGKALGHRGDEARGRLLTNRVAPIGGVPISSAFLKPPSNVSR